MAGNGGGPPLGVGEAELLRNGVGVAGPRRRGEGVYKVSKIVGVAGPRGRGDGVYKVSKIVATTRIGALILCGEMASA